MKKYYILLMLCIANVGFAQVKVNSVGNTGMGKDPNSKAKLLLYNKSSATDTIFGLHSTMDNISTSSTKPVYGIYSINNSNSACSLYGAYFKNKQTRSTQGSAGPTYGIYLDNVNYAYSGSSYGVYLNSDLSGYGKTAYGFYADNSVQATYGTAYGAYLKNTRRSGGMSGNPDGLLYGVYVNNVDSGPIGSVYGAYLVNTKIGGGDGNVYGVYSTSSNGATGGAAYGAYLSAARPTSAYPGVPVYGIFSTVSGGDNNYRYAGYFTGGKVAVMYGNVGIGMTNPSYELDVNGTIRATLTIPSDERLKTDIKPLTNEKEKLYLLEGKSYKKTLLPTGLENSLVEKREIIEIEIPEYGYLAQELKEVFPDLVSQSRDSAGYYSVNYIGLIPVIVEALKDQRLEIEKQREQIKQLVKLIDIKSVNEKVFEENGIESIPLLLQNTPNPFNRTTEIGYYIPENVNSANIYIYDINGFQQRNIAISERGKGATTLQASALQAGIYFYTLICDGKPVDTKQMILTR